MIEHKGHIFKKTHSLGQCNINVCTKCFNQYIEHMSWNNSSIYYLLIGSDDDWKNYAECLTCDEMMIKAILE